MHWTIHHHNTVTSTNDIARDLIKSGAPEGTVVTADMQTAGRGSRGRHWISPPGVNLLASIVLYPDLPFEKTVELSFVTAVSIAEALRDIGLDAKIKWPNDVLVKGRKVCGILIETVPKVGENPAVIVGVGINVNWKDMAPDISKTATSVILELGKEMPVKEMLDKVLKRFELHYRDYLQSGLQPVLERWKEMQCTIGRDVRVSTEGRLISGKAAGIDDAGSLLVKTDEGIITVTAAGTLLAEG